MAKGSGLLYYILKAFLKPVQSHKHDKCIDSNWIGEGRDDIKGNLLIQQKRIYINPIEC